MLKRAVCTLAAVVSISAVLAFTVSPISPSVAWAALTAAPIKEARNTPAPRSSAEARKVLRADVMKIAHDYAHQRYRAVCADLTKKQRKHLGGTSKCVLAVAVLNAYMPIKKFTITKMKLSNGDATALVSLFVNGNKKHLMRALVKWEGGQYRLDHESGWHPKL